MAEDEAKRGAPPRAPIAPPPALRMPELSPALEAALADVFPSDDPIDKASFDPVAYLNQVFPDEASLGNRGFSQVPPKSPSHLLQRLHLLT